MMLIRFDIFITLTAVLTLTGSLVGCKQQPEAQQIEDQSVRRERLAIAEGNRHYDHGDYKDAVEAYDKAIKENPQSAPAYYNRGLAYSRLIGADERNNMLLPDSLRQKDTYRDRAIADFNRVRQTPDTVLTADVEYNLGNLFYKDAEYFYEMDSLQQALPAPPAEGQQQNFRSHALQTVETSIEAYKNCLTLQPDRTEAVENLRLAQILRDKLKDNNDGGGNDNQNQNQDQDQQQQDQQQNQQDQQQDQQDQQQNHQPQPQQPQKSNEELERQLRAVQLKEDQTRRDKNKDEQPAYGSPARKPW